ncbi:ABCF3, partial [Symbiodinium sp. KB8]
MSALDISSASTMLHTQRYHSQRREKAKGKKAAKDASPEQTPVPAPTGDKFEGLDEHVESVLWTTSRGRADIGESTSVNLKRLTISIDSKELLKDATLRLNGGEVYGLVGRNGVGEYGVAEGRLLPLGLPSTGKTTLLRYIVTGKIDNFPRHLRSVLVEQEVQGGKRRAEGVSAPAVQQLHINLLFNGAAGPLSALEEVIAADEERTALMEEEERLMVAVESSPEAVQRLEAITDRLLAIDAYEAESRAAAILRGIGFSDERMKMPTSALSGGWRMRVSFAKALFMRPDLLLMDEPSNHLDLVALAWLEEYISTHSADRITVIVSHDRALLNSVATEIIHMKDQTLKYYP